MSVSTSERPRRSNNVTPREPSRRLIWADSVGCDSRSVALAIRAAFEPEGLSVYQANGKPAGQTVFHFHLHLVPRHDDDGMQLTWPVKNPPREKLEDYAAKIRNDHPGRFGMFVNLPLPDVDGSLAEIEYGMDQLKADGVCLFTSYGDKWLGDPAFDKVFAELNRRKCVVYVHPTTCTCCTNMLPGFPDSAIEYGTDTTRAIARLVFSGTFARCPDIKMIWSHGGGTMPFLYDRFNNATKMPQYKDQFPGGWTPVANKMFYDVAQVPSSVHSPPP